MLSLSEWCEEQSENLYIEPSPEMLEALTDQVEKIMQEKYVGHGILEVHPLWIRIHEAIPDLEYRWDPETEKMVPEVPEKHSKCVALLERGTLDFHPLGRFLDLS